MNQVGIIRTALLRDCIVFAGPDLAAQGFPKGLNNYRLFVGYVVVLYLYNSLKTLASFQAICFGSIPHVSNYSQRSNLAVVFKPEDACLFLITLCTLLTPSLDGSYIQAI